MKEMSETTQTKHGKWLVSNYDMLTYDKYITPYDGLHGIPFCSVCRRDALFNRVKKYVSSNYCPYCGAKMDLE